MNQDIDQVWRKKYLYMTIMGDWNIATIFSKSLLPSSTTDIGKWLRTD